VHLYRAAGLTPPPPRVFVLWPCVTFIYTGVSHLLTLSADDILHHCDETLELLFCTITTTNDELSGGFTTTTRDLIGITVPAYLHTIYETLEVLSRIPQERKYRPERLIEAAAHTTTIAYYTRD
jgi:hypothetical protein